MPTLFGFQLPRLRSCRPKLTANGGGMKMLPIEGDFLSSYIKVEAGYNP